ILRKSNFMGMSPSIQMEMTVLITRRLLVRAMFVLLAPPALFLVRGQLATIIQGTLPLPPQGRVVCN
ncbi:MAG: hypothetical protein LBV12_05360, partial [Puniceicoccales bacterium]|nr:hypothetical protein [Puniceicoccales bacterium]